MRHVTLLLGIFIMLGSFSACSRSNASGPVPPPDAASFDVPAPATQPQSTDNPASAPAASQPATTRTAVFAGGCFWCTEAVFEQLQGVSAVVSGYAGGDANTATYAKVSAGQTKHAEVIQITYDPQVITYRELLHVFFATAHDPTQLNRQGPDVGTQYRSAVFYQSPEEQAFVQAYIDQLNEAGIFDKPIATTLEPLTTFHAAEAYHQDFVDRNPTQGYVEAWAVPKVKKTREKFADQLKD